MMRLTGGVLGQLMLAFTLCLAITFLVSSGGFWVCWNAITTFETQVVPRQANAIAIVSMESDFKKQVQEWKDVLLRGSDPEAFAKHWSNFQTREHDVDEEGRVLISATIDPEALELVRQFVSAHKTMGEAYRNGLQQYRESKFDSRVGDKAVGGMDRAPTELLTKAKERILLVAAAQATEAATHGRRAVSVAIGLMVMATLLAVALFLAILQRSITRPLNKVAHMLGDLSHGQTTTVIEGLDRSDVNRR